MNNDYIPADMVTTNFGCSPEVWDKLQEYYAKHLKENPICEICYSNSSVRITPLGIVKAACMECIEMQRQMLIDSYKENLKNDENWL